MAMAFEILDYDAGLVVQWSMAFVSSASGGFLRGLYEVFWTWMVGVFGRRQCVLSNSTFTGFARNKDGRMRTRTEIRRRTKTSIVVKYT